MNKEWRCFHCDEVFTNVGEARDHFGLDGFDFPACVEAITEEQKAIIEDRREWKNRALAAESERDTFEYQLGLFESDLKYKFKGAKSVNDAFHLYDFMEGRALAAEERLAEYVKRYNIKMLIMNFFDKWWLGEAE